tara:strand:- start:206 stop:565 length:360 start_codon:yes stop_codon:yes gene_type:complete
MSYKIILPFLICFLLAGCPATLKVALTNDTDSAISVLYSTGFKSEIKAGEIKKEHYKFDCVRIKSGETVYEFQPIRPPKNYVDQGVFSSSVNAIFTKDNELKIYVKSDPDKSLGLKKGC